MSSPVTTHGKISLNTKLADVLSTNLVMFVEKKQTPSESLRDRGGDHLHLGRMISGLQSVQG
jgi:hypothetical protein